MSEIRKIKRKDLDLEKYSKAINEALSYRIYAEYWYLDILTNKKWECWVYGDYEVVMPVPLQYKFGFKFVLQPIYCQQLGVFYREEIPDELFREFEKKLHKCRVRAYHFNEENTERYHPKGEKRVNYILDLNRPYEEIFENYTKHRRKDIRKAERLGVKIVEAQSKENFVGLFLINYPHLNSVVKSEFLSRYLENLLLLNKIILCDVLDESGNLIGAQMFVASGNRVICMGFARDKNRENHNASAFVIDDLIRKFSGQRKLVDFEGSVNPKIADFMEGFDPEKRHYTIYLNFTVKNLLRSLRNVWGAR